MKIEKFWMVMRLSKSSDDVQQVDSLPHFKHKTREAADTEAKRLVSIEPNARGFVVLECVGGHAPLPQTEAIEVGTPAVTEADLKRAAQAIANGVHEQLRQRALKGGGWR